MKKTTPSQNPPYKTAETNKPSSTKKTYLSVIMLLIITTVILILAVLTGC